MRPSGPVILTSGPALRVVIRKGWGALCEFAFALKDQTLQLPIELKAKAPA